MKLRLTQDTVRLRLTAGEVAYLAEEGRLEESARFGPGANEELTWAVELSDRVNHTSAIWSGGRLTVLIPSKEGRRWAEGEDDGLEAEQPAGADRRLRVIIEKDLPPRRK